MTISLPFPPAILNPNRRAHWTAKARAAKKYKADCLLLLSAHKAALKGSKCYSLRFLPPDKRPRDLDNMLSASKQLLDSLSVISGVDDRHFSLEIAKGEPVKHGAVLVSA